MNIEKFECERLGNEYKSLLEQICYYLDYKSYISKVNIDKIRDLALKLETGECEIIQFKNSICKFDVDEKIKEEVEKKEQEKDKEIERLNNIIEKLEIDIEIGTGKYTYDTDYNRGLSDAFIYMEARIKELKGEDKDA